MKVERVVQHIRPRHFFPFVRDGEYVKHDNLYGITILFEIHHSKELVVAKWSICNGDNFSKKVGRRMAETSPMSETFTFDTIGLNECLLDALLAHITKKYNTHTPWTFGKMLNLFRYVGMRVKQEGVDNTPTSVV